MQPRVFADSAKVSWCSLVLFFLTISALLAPLSHAKKRSDFAVSLTKFNGKAWGDLVLRQTTSGQLKDKYNSKGSDYSVATKLLQPRTSNLMIDALWSEKGGKSRVLNAFVIGFREPNPTGPTVEELRQNFGQGEVWYQPGRLEDWRLLVFPRVGVCAFVLTQLRTTRVEMMILAPPTAFSTLKSTLSSEPQPIVRREDPGAGWDRVVEFGRAEVRVDLGRGLGMDDSDRRSVVSDIKDATARGTLSYHYGAPGSYEVSISGSGNRVAGGEVTVAVTISGSSPYGPLSASTTVTKRWGKAKKVEQLYMDREDTAYTQALLEARSSAESRFASEVRSAGPPPLYTVRAGQWGELIKRIRSAAELAPATLS